MNWKPGDRAILIDDGSVAPDCSQFIGIEVGLLCLNDEFPHRVEWDVDCGGIMITAAEQCLRPIPDEYDGLEVTTWDECPFKPAVFV